MKLKKLALGLTALTMLSACGDLEIPGFGRELGPDKTVDRGFDK